MLWSVAWVGSWRPGRVITVVVPDRNYENVLLTSVKQSCRLLFSDLLKSDLGRDPYAEKRYSSRGYAVNETAWEMTQKGHP